MTRLFKNEVTYFLREGRENLSDCLELSFEAATRSAVDKIVVFTAFGEGLRKAIDNFLVKPEYASLQLIGVTFPQGKEYTQDQRGVSADNLSYFKERRVPLVRSHLPFDPIPANYRNHSILGQDTALIRNALGIFGGGLSLCVQASLMACDAGLVDEGDHVIALSADTAILARCSPTTRFLTDFVIREVICKPVFMTISKREDFEDENTKDVPSSLVLEGSVDELPTGPDSL